MRSIVLGLILLLVIGLTLPLEVFAAEVFSDDFESGDITNWTGTLLTDGSVAAGASNPHHDTYGLNATINNDAVAGHGHQAFVYKTVSNMNVAYLRAYVKFEDLPAASDTTVRTFLLYESGSSRAMADAEVVVIGENLRWSMVYRASGAYVRANASSGPTVNIWYCIELMCDLSTADGTSDGAYQMWVDGVSVLSASSIDTDTTHVETVYVGRGSGYDGAFDATSAGTTYLDCVVLADSAIGEEVDVYTLSLTVESPTNTTYDQTIPVSLSTTGNATNIAYNWNVKFSNGTWLYAVNKTSPVYTIEIYENQTNCLFACVVTGDVDASDYEEVYFSVLYILADAWDADLNNYFCAAILLVFGFVFMVFMLARRNN